MSDTPTCCTAVTDTSRSLGFARAPMRCRKLGEQRPGRPHVRLPRGTARDETRTLQRCLVRPPEAWGFPNRQRAGLFPSSAAHFRDPP